MDTPHDTPRLPSSLSDDDLLAATNELLRRSCAVEAELIVHLGEIDARKLYAERAFDSMFAFCVAELGLSEDSACNRIAVARAARRFPAVLDALAAGQVHLAGVRMIAPHMTEDNHRALLDEAAGKSKRQIEEVVARLTGAGEPRFRIRFMAGRAFYDKLRLARDLLRPRFPTGDLESVLGAALDLLLAQVQKRRFGVVGKPRRPARERSEAKPSSHERKQSTRYVEAQTRRTVYGRDGGQCTYVDARGRRCTSKAVEFDHVDGFARTHEHDKDRMRLLCRTHNKWWAEQMYGKAFMERAVQARTESIRPGADGPPPSAHPPGGACITAPECAPASPS